MDLPDARSLQAQVHERAGLGFGCPIEEQEKGQHARREKVNAKRREDRARALAALAFRNVARGG